MNILCAGFCGGYVSISLGRRSGSGVAGARLCLRKKRSNGFPKGRHHFASAPALSRNPPRGVLRTHKDIQEQPQCDGHSKRLNTNVLMSECSGHVQFPQLPQERVFMASLVGPGPGGQHPHCPFASPTSYRELRQCAPGLQHCPFCAPRPSRLPSDPRKSRFKPEIQGAAGFGPS